MDRDSHLFLESEVWASRILWALDLLPVANSMRARLLVTLLTGVGFLSGHAFLEVFELGLEEGNDLLFGRTGNGFTSIHFRICF